MFLRSKSLQDVTPPANFIKDTPDTAVQVRARSVTPDAYLTGHYCSGSQVLAVEVENEAKCKEYCHSITSCAFMAFYPTHTVREDADPSSCDRNCRLYSSCEKPVPSLCLQPPLVSRVQVFPTSLVTLDWKVYRCFDGAVLLPVTAISSCSLVADDSREPALAAGQTSGRVASVAIQTTGGEVITTATHRILRCPADTSQDSPSRQNVLRLPEVCRGS